MHVSELPQYAAALFYWNAIGWSGTVTKVNIKPIFGKNENIVQLLKEQIDERREKLDRLAKLRKSLKEKCVAIYEVMGMDLNTAFRMFMERTRMVRGLPFPAVLPDKRITKAEAKAAIDGLRTEAADLPEITLDEINAEISVARAEMMVIVQQKQ